MTPKQRAELERAIAELENRIAYHEPRKRDAIFNEDKQHHADEAKFYGTCLTAARERLAMEGAKAAKYETDVLHVFEKLHDAPDDGKWPFDRFPIDGIIYHPATERGEGEG